MIKPKYLTITPFFPTATSFRGPFIYDQVKAIQETGFYDAIVLKPKPWYSKEKDYEFEGINVYRFKTYELPSNILPGLFNFLSIWSLKYKLKTIGVKIKAIEVAHTHVTGLGIYAIALKKNNPKIKSVLQHHGFDVLSLENGLLHNRNWHRIWVKNYGVKICNAIDLHVGVSEKTLALLKRYNKIVIKDSHVLYNGVDTNKFHPIPSSKDSSFYTVGCVGNFWPSKDQITLLKAIKILVDQSISNLRVKFIGTGETLAICKNYVLENKLDKYVEFIDTLPHHQLVHFYNTLDLFVLPSFDEAFGCVYIEAHACGIPFIAVEGQGIAELILAENKEKQLIKKADSVNLSSLIIFYLNNKSFFPMLSIDYKISTLIRQFITKINL